MDSLNTTIDSQYQPIIMPAYTITPEIRSKVSHLAVEIDKELKTESRMELLGAFNLIFCQITEDEWTSAQRERPLGEMKMIEYRPKGRNDLEGMDRLAKHICDQLNAALEDYQEKVYTEVKEAIQCAMKATKCIVEKLERVCKRGNLDAEQGRLPPFSPLSNVKKEEEKPAKSPLRFNKTQGANRRRKIHQNNESQLRWFSQKILQKTEEKFDQAALNALKHEKKPENTCLYTQMT